MDNPVGEKLRNASRAGDVFIVTGANSGLGLETARNLAGMSSDNIVILACRDPDKAETVRLSIVTSTGNT
jgi:NAD(P)-dependent dehydrogenase (short-subunit alcohol dehydrogenase family)